MMGSAAPAPTVRHASIEYRPAIDGLRALAVLSVFVFHLNHEWLPGGFVGVDVFFVISGYLITSIIYQECRTDTFSLRRFYQRRIARIFPAFFAVALTTLMAACLIYASRDFAAAGASLAAAALSIINLKLITQGDYFHVLPDGQPFLHYWSLSVEEQFYLCFPPLLLLLFKRTRPYLVWVLGFLCAGSFVASVLMTQTKPVWAFYLLPTRAWELLAGCLLAVTTAQVQARVETWWPPIFSLISLGLVMISFFFIQEGDSFPGYWPLLPVAGAVGLLHPTCSRGAGEKWLASAPLVAVGRISYSLYLWHWPVFAMVDYQLCFGSEPVRLALKIGISFLAAVLSFRLIEQPAREFLNRRPNMFLAYAGMMVAVAVCVPLGLAIRKNNYVSAAAGDVINGGIVFDSKSTGRSVILMGDSNGSMYGAMIRDVCAELGYKLSVISVITKDPLPQLDGRTNQLWLDSFDLVRREKPDYLLLICRWELRLKDGKEKARIAVEALKPYVGHLIILNQPPVLPAYADRAAIRAGARPPFFENAELRRQRTEANDYLQRFRADNCAVIDVAAHFSKTNGDILFLDEQGRQLYYDFTHLSGIGADRVRGVLKPALSPKTKN